MFSSKLSLLGFLFLFQTVLFGQNCSIVLSGSITDKSTGEPIAYANVYLKEATKGVVSDSLGGFKISAICKGDYHLSISHIGCETQELFIKITKDSTLTAYLDHNSKLLKEVAIIGQGGKVTTQNTEALNGKDISENSEKNLAVMLSNIVGVSTISNGSAIAKPIVNGMYGNRLTVLNNGVAQSGQQWGVDHSPEIDPLAANKITVIKGVGAIEYQGSSLGNVILVEPGRIVHDPHLHGKVKYVFKSNGLGSGLNLDLQQYNRLLSWRAVGTVKKSGDNRTPTYFLNNTGAEEANIAVQLEKSFNKKWTSNLYFSSFNAQLGILRGSQVGNLTDLEEAFTREVPFYTEEQFSFAIDAPYQKVNHQFLKFNTRFLINSTQRIDFTYASQYNLRKEFDVRRSGRSEMPALSLKQNSHFLESKYENNFSNNWVLKTGIQVNRINNENIPETGILPLIPDYISYEYGLYSTITKNLEKASFELGARYDFENRKVAAISISVPREVVRYENKYHNFTAMGGVNYTISKSWVVGYNLGYAQRNPDVNELYSNGLHQGVSGIEEGDPALEKESSLKNTLSLKVSVKDKLFVETLFYYQLIDDYIFLNPQDEIRLTIRGAFPVFKYEQTNAQIFGFDMAGTYEVTERISLTGKYSYLYGYDMLNDLPLVYMPANNLYGELNYRIPKLGPLQNVEFQINNKFVFKQNNLLPSQDFVAPPDAYNLLGLKISSEMQVRKLGLMWFVKAENLLNATYRDYLNRQRYFADDLGLNIVVGINISF